MQKKERAEQDEIVIGVHTETQAAASAAWAAWAASSCSSSLCGLWLGGSLRLSQKKKNHDESLADIGMAGSENVPAVESNPSSGVLDVQHRFN